MSWWSRLTNVFTAGRLERELDDELQFHRDERIRELMASGQSREAATSAVARRFGNPLLLREQSRDVKLFPWLDSLVRDVRQGIRALGKHAGVTGASVLSLALALGACVAAFSLVDALILRPLPVRQPERLVYLAFPTDNPERPEADTFNDPLFVRLRDASREHVALFAMSTQVIRPTIFADSGGEKERLRTQYLSGDAFEQLGVTPAAGRLIGIQDDDQPGAHPVAVLSHAFWLRRFGGDPSVLGRWLTLEGRQLQIVGVAERTFTGVEPGRPTDLWLPYTMYNPRAFGNPQFGWFRIFGRLKDGVRVEQAQSVAACGVQRLPARIRAEDVRAGRDRRNGSHASSTRRSTCGPRPMVRRRCASSSSARSGSWARSRRWSCSSPARTSPICFSPGPRRASARWPSACRSAPAAGG